MSGGISNSLTQQLLLRQRLLPQQLRLVALVEKTDDEVEQEIARELDENPALERVRDDSRPLPSYAVSTGPAAPSPTDFAPEFDRTLGETLLDQLAELTGLSDAVRHITAYMIGALDSNGYLTRTLPQLSTDLALETDGTLSFTDADLRAAYATLRSLDPAGVGAQDLRDCLLLQLERLDATQRPEVADATELVRHFFDVYSRRNMRKLSELTGISPERIQAADSVITALNPKPGAPFAADPSQSIAESAVQPDFIIETDGKRVSVSMPNSLPELRIEESFNATDSNSPAAAFIRDRRSQALSFIDLLKRRQSTLMAIARAIVKIQAPFFLNFDDESKIKPMVLRQIADETGLDLTLISRAVAGKWMATQWGVYSLKSFFNHRTGADDTETSAREICAALREIIAAEPADAPLSDEALAEALAGRGYKVARRTVAKYRTRLNIAPARLRRK